MYGQQQMVSRSLLLVEDDLALVDMLSTYLGAEKLHCHPCSSGRQAIHRALTGSFDLMILDIGLPDISGFTVLREIRNVKSLPVLMLTARGDDIDRILGLELGADDYLAKPFNVRELSARIRSILRRTQPMVSGGEHGGGERLEVGDLLIDSHALRVNVDGRDIELTPSEFSCLQVLARHAGTVVDRDMLSLAALRRSHTLGDRAIDMHVSSLRRKLGPLPGHTARIQAVRGQGYVLRIRHASSATTR